MGYLFIYTVYTEARKASCYRLLTVRRHRRTCFADHAHDCDEDVDDDVVTTAAAKCDKS